MGSHGPLNRATPESPSTYARRRSEAATALAEARALLDASGLLESNGLLREAAEKIDRALGALPVSANAGFRNEFLSTICHDLKDPLAAMQMAVACLLRSPELETGRARRMTEAMRNSGERMQRIVRNLGDFVHIETGRLEVKPAECSIEQVLNDTMKNTEHFARERGVEIVVQVSSGSIAKLDRERIVGALTHLAHNAIRASLRGKSVRIGARIGPGQLGFFVRDEGPGLSEETRAHLFDAYWHSSRSPRDGTGLGLAITKGIVDAHHGTIAVDTGAQGTEFTVSLPN